MRTARNRRPWAIATGIVALSLAGAGGFVSAQPMGGDTAGTGKATIDSATGAQTYREICQACHMADAKGGSGAGTIPALASNAHLADPDFTLTRVLRGRGGMPAFSAMLSPAQIAGVVGYVRTHFGNDYTAAVTVADVKRLAPANEGE